MNALIPCEACRRHVRAGDAACPFCDAPNECTRVAPVGTTTRLGRAAMFAFRTTTVVALSTLGACGDGGPAPVCGGPPSPPGASLAAPPTPIPVLPTPPPNEAPPTSAAPTADGVPPPNGLRDVPAYGGAVTAETADILQQAETVAPRSEAPTGSGAARR